MTKTPFIFRILKKLINKLLNVMIQSIQRISIMQKYGLIVIAVLAILTASYPVDGYIDYDLHVVFLQTLTKDAGKLLPRAMDYYIYQNDYDFFRGITFMLRNIEEGPRKLKDPEEIRREAYARLLVDIPYCISALSSGEIKQDTSHANIASRLGMIAFSIYLLKLPDTPDLVYSKRFRTAFERLIVENGIDVKVYYDGYQDFLSLGELMERLQPEFTVTLASQKNKEYVTQMKEDPFSMFRPPEQMEKHIIMTDLEVNRIYGATINGILDAYVYIWKCSGMDLAHPSYTAPPYTLIYRRAVGRSIVQTRQKASVQDKRTSIYSKTAGSP